MTSRRAFSLWVLLVALAACRQGAGTEPSPRGSLPEPSPEPPSAASGNSSTSASNGIAPPAQASAPLDGTAPELFGSPAPSSASATAAPTASSASTAPSTPGIPRRYVVAVIGDSLTDYASPLGGGYLRLLEKECPQSRFDNFGKGGAMVNQMRRRFREQVLGPTAPRYTHVLLFGGINDLYSDLTAHRTNDKISADLEQMYTWAHEGGAEVIAVGITPWGGFRKYWNPRREANTQALNGWIRDQVGKGVDHYVDAYSLLACGTKICPDYSVPFKDGIHFGKAGHAVLGRALRTQVFSDCL